VRPNFWRREEWAEIFANPIARGLRAEVGTAERSTAEERADLLNHITKRVSGFVNRYNSSLFPVCVRARVCVRVCAWGQACVRVLTSLV
jgi:hypothetical protein